MTKSHTKV